MASPESNLWHTIQEVTAKHGVRVKPTAKQPGHLLVAATIDSFPAGLAALFSPLSPLEKPRIAEYDTRIYDGPEPYGAIGDIRVKSLCRDVHSVLTYEFQGTVGAVAITRGFSSHRIPASGHGDEDFWRNVLRQQLQSRKTQEQYGMHRSTARQEIDAVRILLLPPHAIYNRA